MIGLGSATEARYLIDLAHRLGYVDTVARASLDSGYGSLLRQLETLIASLQRRA